MRKDQTKSVDIKRVELTENIFLITLIVIVFFVTIFLPDDTLSLWAIISPYVLGILIHHYIYVSSFLFTEQYFLYFFLVLLLLLGIIFFSDAIVSFLQTRQGDEWAKYVVYESSPMLNAGFAVLVMGFDMGLRFIFRGIKEKILHQERESQDMQRKMEMLMFQISPHFLMNTLNNIHALVDTNTEKAKEAIVSLSRMLRYTLYETSPDAMVSLQRQMEILDAYCDLHLLRYGKNVKVNIVTPRELPATQIPPLVLIVFVENAFKHGVAYGKESTININIWDDATWLHFTVSNPIMKDQIKPPSITGGPGGVGLVNVKKRLDMIYGDNYSLTNEAKDDMWLVHLIIPLKK